MLFACLDLVLVCFDGCYGVGSLWVLVLGVCFCRWLLWFGVCCGFVYLLVLVGFAIYCCFGLVLVILLFCGVLVLVIAVLFLF